VVATATASLLVELTNQALRDRGRDSQHLLLTLPLLLLLTLPFEHW